MDLVPICPSALWQEVHRESELRRQASLLRAQDWPKLPTQLSLYVGPLHNQARILKFRDPPQQEEAPGVTKGQGKQKIDKRSTQRSRFKSMRSWLQCCLLDRRGVTLFLPWFSSKFLFSGCCMVHMEPLTFFMVRLCHWCLPTLKKSMNSIYDNSGWIN